MTALPEAACQRIRAQSSCSWTQGHRAGEGPWLLLNKLRNSCSHWIRREAGAGEEPAGMCEDHVSLMVIRVQEGLGESRHLPTPDAQSPGGMVKNRISGG